MKFGNHTVGDGEIQLVSVVNPCFYWVRCADCPSMENIHDLLNSYRPAPVTNVSPGDRVVIKLFDQPKFLDQEMLDHEFSCSWFRAVVVELNGIHDIIIYLPDNMTYWTVNRSSLYAIENAKWEEISTPHLIGLYGGVPAPSDGHRLEDDFVKRITSFLKSHKDNVLTFSFDEKCKLRLSKSSHIDDVLVFGKVKLKTPKMVEDLLCHLIHAKWAIYQEDYSEVLENDGWLRTVVKEIEDINRAMNANLSKSKKVLNVIPPPPDLVDRDRFAALRQIYFSQIEDQILPIIRTESHEEHNERMRQSALLNGTKVAATESGSKNSSPIVKPSSLISREESPQPPRSISKGERDDDCWTSDEEPVKEGVILHTSLYKTKQPQAKVLNVLPEPSGGCDLLHSLAASLNHCLVESPQPLKFKGRGFFVKQLSNTATRMKSDGSDGCGNIKLSKVSPLAGNCTLTESPQPPKSIERGCFEQFCRGISTHVKSMSSNNDTMTNDNDNHDQIQQPKPLKGYGRGLFAPRMETVATSLDSSICLVASQERPATGQFDDAESPVSPDVARGNGVLNRDLPIVKRCCYTLPSSGSGNFSLGSDRRERRVSSSTPATKLGSLPDSKSLPADETLSLVQRKSKPTFKFSGSERTPVIQFGTKNQPQHSSPVSGSTQSSVFQFGTKSLQNSNSASVVLDQSETKTSSDLQTNLSDIAVALQNPVQLDTISKAINIPVGGDCNGAVSSQQDLPDHLFESEPCVVVASKSLEDTKGLIFGVDSSDIKVATHLGDLNLDPGIKELARRASLMSLTRPQSLMMPAILERRDVILIGPNRSRKTSAYLVPIMSLLMDTEYYSGLPPGNGPRCIVVAPTSDRVRTIGQLCSQYGGQSLKTITTYGGGLEKERMHLLSAGCDILVTTPRCWLRLKEFPIVTNARRLCHLVLDRFDVLQELFLEELKHIIAHVKVRCATNVKLPRIQIVTSGEKWTPPTEIFTKKVLHAPVLVFTSFVECAVLCKIKPALILRLTPDNKIDELLKDLIEKHSTSKIAVACNTYDDVFAARDAIYSTNRNPCVVVAHEKMPRALLNQITDEWTLKKRPVLIFSDHTLNDFSVTDAEILIHFSLSPSKSSFGDRFVTVRDAMVQTVLNPGGEARAKVYMIISGLEDPKNEVAFPFVVDYLQRFRVKVPDPVIDYVKILKRRKEENKKAHFCDNILQTGRCSNEYQCKFRHALRKSDQDDLTFTKGLVKLDVCHIHSAVKFSVRILAHNPHPSGEGTWVQIKNKYTRVLHGLSNYFCIHGNRRIHDKAQIGDVVAYTDDVASSFHRARVVDIVQRDHHNEPKTVRIFLMDLGYEVDDASVSTLFELPTQLGKYPDQCEILYIADLKPVDLDTSWSLVACNTVENAVAATAEEMQTKDEVLARLMFRFGNVSIVDNLRWSKRHKTSTTIALDLRQTIVSSGCGLNNPEYTETMEQLFQEADLDYPGMKVFQLPKIEEKKKPPAWAHLPSEPHVYTHVQIHHAVSPNDTISPARFYVKSNNFQNELMSLERDINAVVNERSALLSNPKVGDICISESPHHPADERIWRRCMIKDVHNVTVTVLFVDHGELCVVPVHQLFEIPWNFVTKLPFQAIECCLAGVKPSVDEDAEWCEEGVQDFLEQITNKEMYLKVIATQKTAHLTGGRRYEVAAVLLDSNNDMFCVNKTLNFGMSTIKDFEVDFEALKSQYKESFSNQDANEADAQVVAEDDDWNEPYVPPQRQEQIRSGLVDLAINEDDFDLFGAEALIERFFPSLLPTLNKRKAMMIEEGAYSVAPQNHLAEPVRKEDEKPEVVSPKIIEAGEDTAVAAQPSLKSEDSAVAANCSSTSDVFGLSAATEQPTTCAHIEQTIPHRTPKVCWLQAEDTVTLRFMIPCLSSYHLEFSNCSVTLIAWVHNDGREDLYHRTIILFGGVNGVFEEREGASYLSVKLRKLVSGHNWPRLTLLDTIDKRICYVEGDTPDDDDGSLVAKYLKHGESAHLRKKLEEEDCGVELGYLPPAPENDIESDDDLVCPIVRAGRVADKDDVDEFDPMGDDV